MNDDFREIVLPAPSGFATVDQTVHGPLIPPQQRILLYSASEWEEFVLEWAHYCLKKEYIKVLRFSGAGDHGIDIAGFTDALLLRGVWDNYQCKHYSHGLYPSDAWPEIGKVLWYSFKGEYKPPRKYFFVAPRGAGTALQNLLAYPAKLKKELFKHWDANVQNKITETGAVKLEGAFLAYVDAFDFSIFEAKTALELVDDHRGCPCHAARFGGGLPPRPAASPPPPEFADIESRYIAQLLAAYAEHKKEAVPNAKSLKWPNLREHFGRQREAFYHAESLRIFARDTVPPGTFESLQEDIHTGVIDICDEDYADGYARVRTVTKAARDLQLTSNPLLSCSKPKDRDGICHQLANEDRLIWTKP
jgi:hypothetical protein